MCHSHSARGLRCDGNPPLLPPPYPHDPEFKASHYISKGPHLSVWCLSGGGFSTIKRPICAARQEDDSTPCSPEVDDLNNPHKYLLSSNLQLESYKAGMLVSRTNQVTLIQKKVRQ